MAGNHDPAAYGAECLGKMIERLGIEAKVNGSGEGRQVVLTVASKDSARLIGRRGRTVDSLEYLINRILPGKCEGPVRASISIEGHVREAGDAEGDDDDAAAAPRRRDDRREGGRSEGERDAGGRGVDVDRLERLAGDAAKEVKRWGDAKTIGPFTVGERRVIHNVLKQDPAIVAESGEDLGGRRKKITISPVAGSAE